MTDEMNLKRGKEIFGVICEALNSIDWNYGTDAEKLMIFFRVTGGEQPVQYHIWVEPERQLIQLRADMFQVPQDKRGNMALVLCIVNFGLPDGVFELDIKNGAVAFRMTATYRDAIISKELIKYMLEWTGGVTNHFSKDLLAVAKGEMGTNDFYQKYK